MMLKNNNLIDIQKLLKSFINNQRFRIYFLWTIGGIFFIFGILLGYYNSNNNHTQAIFAIVFCNIGALIITNIAIGLITQPIQRSFMKELLEQLNISENIKKWGIIDIVDKQGSITWEDEFNKSKNVKLFFSTNNEWKADNYVPIKSFLEKGGKLTVVLPDSENENYITEMAEKHDISIQKCKEDTRKAITGFYDLKKLKTKEGKNVNVNIYCISLDVYFTAYCFDDSAYIVYRSYHKLKSDVPHIHTKSGGKLYDFIDDQFELIINDERTKLVEDRNTFN